MGRNPKITQIFSVCGMKKAVEVIFARVHASKFPGVFYARSILARFTGFDEAVNCVTVPIRHIADIPGSHLLGG